MERIHGQFSLHYLVFWRRRLRALSFRAIFTDVSKIFALVTLNLRAIRFEMARGSTLKTKGDALRKASRLLLTTKKGVNRGLRRMKSGLLGLKTLRSLKIRIAGISFSFFILSFETSYCQIQWLYCFRELSRFLFVIKLHLGKFTIKQLACFVSKISREIICLQWRNVSR